MLLEGRGLDKKILGGPKRMWTFDFLVESLSLNESLASNSQSTLSNQRTRPAVSLLFNFFFCTSDN